MMKMVAPIDDRNILEDPIEDEVFRDFYVEPYHKKSRWRNVIGTVKTENYDAIVAAAWEFGDNEIQVNVVGYQPTEDIDEVRKEVYDHYEQVFKSWQCEDNPCLVVETERTYLLSVKFYYEIEEE